MGLGIKIPRNALAKGAKEFKDNPNGDNVELEPGTYLAVVTGMKGVDTKNGPQVILECKIGGDVDESIKGGKTALWFSFDEDRVIHLIRTLAKLGYDVDDLDAKKLEEIAEEIKKDKHVVRLKATQKDEFINVRLNKVMQDMDADEVLAGEGDTEEEEEETEEEEKPKKGKKKKDEEEEETEEEEEEEEEEKPKKKDKKKKKDEEEEEETEEEETEEEEEKEEENTVLKVGMKVKFKIKGELHKGKVVSIDTEEGKVVVKSDKDGKKYRLSPDKLED